MWQFFYKYYKKMREFFQKITLSCFFALNSTMVVLIENHF